MTLIGVDMLTWCQERTGPPASFDDPDFSLPAAVNVPTFSELPTLFKLIAESNGTYGYETNTLRSKKIGASGFIPLNAHFSGHDLALVHDHFVVKVQGASGHRHIQVTSSVILSAKLGVWTR